MLRAGYDTKLSAGVICAGGTLGILIPPSIMLIVYGAAAGVSVVRLYAAAMLPGFLLAGLYVVYVIGRVLINPCAGAEAAARRRRHVPFGQVVLDLLTSFFPLAILILVGAGRDPVRPGHADRGGRDRRPRRPLLAAGYRALTWTNLREAVYLTARTSAMVCFLFIGSANFASIFAYLGGQKLIEEFVLGLDLTPLTFLLLTQFIIFLLGWPLEWTEIIVIFVPIFLPLLDNFGIDPIFFGILVALNLQTAFLTPPMAMSAFYLKGIAPPHVTLGPDLQRLHAVPEHGRALDGAALRLPGHRAVAAVACSTDDRRRPAPPLASRATSSAGKVDGARADRGLPRRHRGRGAARPGLGLPRPRARPRPGPGAATTEARRPAARAAARPARSASRTSSTPPTCRPRTARVLHAGRRPPRDAAVVERLRAAGAVDPRQDRDHRVRRLRARARPATRTTPSARPAAPPRARPPRSRPAWCRSRSAPRPTAR